MSTRPRLQVSLGQHSLAGPGPAGSPNQDCHGALLPSGPLLASKGIALAVADGISSSRVSQEASRTAVAAFLADYYATSDAWSVRRAANGMCRHPCRRAIRSSTSAIVCR